MRWRSRSFRLGGLSSSNLQRSRVMEMTDVSWTEGIARKEAAKDSLGMGERIGEMVAIILGVLVLLFFVANQIQGTGFFTSDFGTMEMVLFYGVLILGMVPPFLRMFLGRRNKVRPVEIICNLFFIVATTYLLWVFPFDFGHLPDLLPTNLQFILDWITNDIAMWFMGIIIVIVTIVTVWTAFLYIAVNDWQRRNSTAPL